MKLMLAGLRSDGNQSLLPTGSTSLEVSRRIIDDLSQNNFRQNFLRSKMQELRCRVAILRGSLENLYSVQTSTRKYISMCLMNVFTMVGAFRSHEKR
jgi:hypothetical protein